MYIVCKLALVCINGLDAQIPRYPYCCAACRCVVQVGNIRFAYRRFGPRGRTPLLLLNYFAANMDNWDPKVTNGFAAEFDVILVDYPGIGSSSGETPTTVREGARARA